MAPTFPQENPSPGEGGSLSTSSATSSLLTERGAKRAATSHQIPLRAADSTWSFLPYKALKGLIKDGFILKLLKGASDKPASAIPALL